MTVSELKKGLSDLQKMLGSLGASKQSGELQALVDALAEFDGMSVPDLSKALKSLSAASKKRAPKPLHEAAVQEALRKLAEAAHLAQSFDAIVAEVLSDKHLGKPELIELCKRFGGTEPPKSTKPAVREFLKERRLEMRRQDGLGVTIDRMFGRTGS